MFANGSFDRGELGVDRRIGYARFRFDDCGRSLQSRILNYFNTFQYGIVDENFVETRIYRFDHVGRNLERDMTLVPDDRLHDFADDFDNERLVTDLGNAFEKSLYDDIREFPFDGFHIRRAYPAR